MLSETSPSSEVSALFSFIAYTLCRKKDTVQDQAENNTVWYESKKREKSDTELART